MNMNKVISVILILAVIIGAYLLLKKPASAPSTEEIATSTSEVATTSSALEAPAGKTYTVTYTDAGYSPNELTIKAGDTVVWDNKSSHDMWTASGKHPTHILYSGTDVAHHCPDTTGTAFDECQAGDTFSFTFDKTGTWPYHNHIKSSDFGKIIVQ
jgi:plastocyanin